MSTVIGIDVSKNSSVASSFVSKNHAFRSPVVFMHTQEGFAEFLLLAHDLERETAEKPYAILEPTGNHHLALLNLLEKNDFKVIMVNPYFPIVNEQLTPYVKSKQMKWMLYI